MDRPHVAICVPSTGHWHAKMAQAVAHLSVASLVECDLGIVNGEGYSVASARNRMVLGQMGSSVSHLLFIDSDMVFPHDGLLRLLKHDKDVVAAAYVKRKPPHELIGKLKEPLDLRVEGPLGARPALELPTGFMLVRFSVFERLKPPWFVETFDFEHASENNPTGLTTEDIYFCRLCLAAGIDLFMDVDLTFEIGHIGMNTNICVRPKQS